MSTEANPPMPLSREDRAILALESETIAGHTCKVILLAGRAPSIQALRRRVGDRLADVPELTWTLAGTPNTPAWIANPSLDVGSHVVEADVGGPVGADALARVVADLFAQRLERDRPLWRLDRVELDDGGCALVWRIHHALADGTTVVRLARATLWDTASGRAPRADARPVVPTSPEADHARRRGHLAGFLEREFARSRARSPFDGSVGTRRRIAFATAPVGSLHDAAKRLAGATLNDAVLAVVTGGLRAWIEAHHGSLGELRARIPVSLHHEGEDAGNRDSFFALGLPLNEPDPVERLRIVHERTVTRKEEHDAEEMDTLLRGLGSASPRLERLCERIEASPRRFALNVSNVPGPREPVSVEGAAVSELHTIAEIGERHALRVAVLSYAGTMCFGLCADPAIVTDLDTLAAGIEAEADALVMAGDSP
jgi:hypothetical protein